MLGLDMLQWAVSMEAYRAQPPDPDLVGEEWRARWRERLDGHEPFILPWLEPSAPRRLLARRLGLRAPRADHLRRLRDRRLGRRLPRRGAADARACARPLARADRAVGPHVARVRQARPRDRLPAGARALLRRLAARRRQRLLGRAAADRLHPGRDPARDELRGARGALGGGGVVAVAARCARRRSSCPAGRRARCAASSSAASTPASGAATAAPPTSPATSAPTTAPRCAGTGPSGRPPSCSATWSPSWRSRPTGPPHSPPCGCATWRRTGRRR